MLVPTVLASTARRRCPRVRAAWSTAAWSTAPAAVPCVPDIRHLHRGVHPGRLVRNPARHRSRSLRDKTSWFVHLTCRSVEPGRRTRPRPPYAARMAGLDDATTVRPAGAGRYDVDLDPAWQIAGRLNGSYLLAVLGRAALAELAATDEGRTFPHPLVASAHYVSSPEPGPATVQVVVLRRGNRTAQTRVSLSTASGLGVEALVTCGTLDDGA